MEQLMTSHKPPSRGDLLAWGRYLLEVQALLLPYFPVQFQSHIRLEQIDTRRVIHWVTSHSITFTLLRLEMNTIAQQIAGAQPKFAQLQCMKLHIRAASVRVILSHSSQQAFQQDTPIEREIGEKGTVALLETADSINCPILADKLRRLADHGQQ